MIDAKGYAAFAAKQALEPFAFHRRELGEQDVQIDIHHCGVCHSDLHQLNNDWGASRYPMVPGHEIVGYVKAIGSQVTKVKVGDPVGVGCMVDSCHQCNTCREGDEQFCEQGVTMTYNSADAVLGGHTYGGYSNKIVVNEHFVLKVPANLDLAASAPLLCAGVTTFAPLKRFGASKGKRVGIAGLGGLGHVAIKIACAMGAEVTLFTRSEQKAEDAKRLGAHHVVVEGDKQALREARGQDIILDTISASHDLNPWLRLLNRNGAMVLVGLPAKEDDHAPVKANSLIHGQRILTGSFIGNIADTQAMLDFCGEHNITCDVERLPLSEVNTALQRLDKNDVKYRFVLDM